MKVKSIFVNFWDDFKDKQYFHEIRRFIKIKFVRLTNNGYMVSIPLKIKSKVIFHIDTNVE